MNVSDSFVNWALDQIESDEAFKHEFLWDMVLLSEKMAEVVDRLIISTWVPNFMEEFNIPAMLLNDDDQYLARMLLQKASVRFADELEIISAAGFLN